MAEDWTLILIRDQFITLGQIISSPKRVQMNFKILKNIESAPAETHVGTTQRRLFDCEVAILYWFGNSTDKIIFRFRKLNSENVNILLRENSAARKSAVLGRAQLAYCQNRSDTEEMIWL